MDLEKRVQALEEEVEILKNQIQATLLDIQEQVLTNTYQSLRSDTPPASNNTRSAADGITSPVKTFKPLDDTVGENRPANGAIANVRKVTLESPEPPPAATISESQGNTITWASMNEMEAWVSRKINNIGVERTRELAYMYFESGRIAPDHIDTLLELIELYEGDLSRPFEHEETTRSSPPSVRQQRQTGTPNAEPRPARPKSPVAPQPKAARKVAESSAAANTARPDVPARKSATPGALPAKPVVNAASPTTPHAGIKANKTEPEPEPEERATVLRLIAGVYNAGAGVKWGKRNG